MQKHFILYFFLSIIIVSIAQTPLQAADISVGDEAALIAAIDKANKNNEPNTITFTADIRLSAKLPIVTGEISIEGNGYALNGANAYRAFHNQGTLTINDLILRRGYDSIDGGSIYNQGMLTITNATFDRNQAARTGGGIYNSGGGTVLVQDSEFIDNISENSGGAAYNNGGAMQLVRCRLSGNTGNAGGAVGVNSGGELSVSDSTFNNNIGRNVGGAISDVPPSNGQISVSNSTFTNNQASEGGAITIYDSPLTVQSSTFIRNLARNGGAIMVDGTAVISDSLFRDNTADGNGGAIQALFYDTLTVSESIFTENSAGWRGGAIRIRDGKSFDIDASVLYGNHATSAGGAISAETVEVTITNSTISGNTARGASGLSLWGGVILINNSTITANAAQSSGGGLAAQFSANITIKNSILAGNTTANTEPECNEFDGTLTFTDTLVGTNDDLGGCSGGTVVTGAIDSVLDTTLADNGGPTPTHALVTGSPAIDSSGTDATTSDQRGAPTIGTRDIGAFEHEGIVAGLNFSDLMICEGCAAGDYTITLNSVPFFDVTIDLVSDPLQCTIESATSLTFTSSNWNEPQEVSITALEDNISEGLHACHITHTASSDDADYNGDFLHRVQLIEKNFNFTLTSPEAGQIIRHDLDAVTLTWSEANSAVSYTLYVTKISDNAGRIGPILEQTLDAEQCTGGTCSFDVDLSGSGDGLYSWTVIASNAFAEGEPSNGHMLFTVDTDPIDLLDNGSFEIDADGDKVPDGWTLRNGTKDKLKCNKTLEDGTVKEKAHTGECAFLFKSSASERSKLKQAQDVSHLDIGPASVLTFQGYMKVPEPGVRGAIKLKVLYKDDTIEASRERLQLQQTVGYVGLTKPITLSAEVSKVKVVVKHTTTRPGKVFLDSFSFIVSENTKTNPIHDGLVPLPDAPSGFRGANTR